MVRAWAARVVRNDVIRAGATGKYRWPIGHVWEEYMHNWHMGVIRAGATGRVSLGTFSPHAVNDRVRLVIGVCARLNLGLGVAVRVRSVSAT